MVKFPTLKTAVERAQELRTGRYGVILYNPKYNEFTLLGPYMKNQKFVFTPYGVNCSFLIVDHWVRNLKELYLCLIILIQIV